MKQDIENIFGLLPFCVDIKYNIYNQMCKHVFGMPKALKDDLQTYFMLNLVIRTYQAELETDYMDQNYFLYSLYNDLIHEHHRQVMDRTNDADILFHNYYFETVRDALYTRDNLQYPFVMKRIKYFWTLLTPRQRVAFIKFMEFKFN